MLKALVMGSVRPFYFLFLRMGSSDYLFSMIFFLFSSSLLIVCLGLIFFVFRFSYLLCFLSSLFFFSWCFFYFYSPKKKKKKSFVLLNIFFKPFSINHLAFNRKKYSIYNPGKHSLSPLLVNKRCLHNYSIKPFMIPALPKHWKKQTYCFRVAKTNITRHHFICMYLFVFRLS